MTYRFKLPITLIFTLLALQAAASVDSLKTLLTHAPDSQRVVLMCDICFGYRLQQTDSALHYCERAVALAKKIGQPRLLAQALNDQGIIFSDLNRYQDALSNYHHALDIQVERNDSVRMGALHSKIGIIHQKQGEYSRAMEHQLSALRIFEAMKIQNYVATCQNNVAILDFNMGEYKRSLEMHQNALETRKLINDQYGVATSYANIGNVQLALKDTVAASTSYGKAADYFEAINNAEGLSTTLHNWSTCYESRDPNRALELLQRALAIRTEMGDEKMLASTHSATGGIWLALGKPLRARLHFLKALQLAQRADVLAEQISVNENLALLYRELGNADSTFYYFSVLQTLKDSTFNEGLRNDFAELQTLYETEQKEARIALLSEQNKVSELKVRQKQNQLWMMIIGFGAFLIVAVLSYMRFREKQRQRMAAEIAQERETGLRAVIEATEAERERIAKDLHDGVGQQLSGMKMAWQKMLLSWQNSGEQERLQAERLTQILDETAAEVRSISHRMMPRSLSQFGLVPAVADMLEKSLASAELEYSFEPFGMENRRYSPEIERSLYRVMQELVNNILKHSGASRVEVQMMQNSGQLVVMVSDNGKGMDKANAGNGIGLSNMQSRLHTVGGNIYFENENGVRATIRIPVND